VGEMGLFILFSNFKSFFQKYSMWAKKDGGKEGIFFHFFLLLLNFFLPPFLFLEKGTGGVGYIFFIF
jgi:hypothetical protein